METFKVAAVFAQLPSCICTAEGVANLPLWIPFSAISSLPAAESRGEVRVHDHPLPLLQRTNPLQRTGAPQRAGVPGEDAQLQVLQGAISLQKHQG